MKARRVSRALLTGVAAAAIAVPVAQASSASLVQIDGKLVAPTQLSKAQIAAGHGPSAGLVQVGGRLLEPAQVSTWQSRAGQVSRPASTSGSSSFDPSTATIAAAAALGALLLAWSVLMLRRRRGLAPA
jgi:hypothetical protein